MFVFIVEKKELSIASDGCKILLKCLLMYMENIKISDNWDSHSSHLNLALAAISALCSAKPLSASEFVSVVAFIKEWPSDSPMLGMFGINNFLVKKLSNYIYV